jgi:hypothetical protein
MSLGRFTVEKAVLMKEAMSQLFERALGKDVFGQDYNARTGVHE